jgi:XTP/dITP diphosphohydrolase
MTAYVLATANAHKVEEISAILAPLGVSLIARPQDLGEVVEDGDSLEENALIKARALVAHTGQAAIADDTGLFVDALGGLPGVTSARYAGPHATDLENLDKLLGAMESLTDEQRTARFITVAAVAYPDGSWFVVEGEMPGHIGHGPRGLNGFGYDPVFIPSAVAPRTLAEISPEEKNELSHRGHAFRALATALATR